MSNDINDKNTPHSPLGHTHDHNHEKEHNCPACNPRETTEEDERAINEDPAMRSLSRALTMSFGLLKGVMLLLVLFFFLDCFTYVKEGQKGLVKRFGKYVTGKDGKVKIYEPGFVFVWPSPFEELEEVSLGTRKITLDEDFWPELNVKDRFDVNQREFAEKDSLNPQRDGYCLTGDLNVIHSRWSIEYKVDTDAPEFYMRCVDNASLKPGLVIKDREPKSEDMLAPADILRSISRSAITKTIAGMDTNIIIFREIKTLVDKVTRQIKSDLLDSSGRSKYGLVLVNVSLIGKPTPPGMAISAFNAFTKNDQEKARIVDEARAEYNQIVQKTDSEADKIVKDSLAYKADVVNKAKGDAVRMDDLLARFPGDPEGLHIYLQQYRYDVFKEILADSTRFFIRKGEQDWFVVGNANDFLLGSDEDKNKEKK